MGKKKWTRNDLNLYAITYQISIHANSEIDPNIFYAKCSKMSVSPFDITTWYAVFNIGCKNDKEYIKLKSKEVLKVQKGLGCVKNIKFVFKLASKNMMLSDFKLTRKSLKKLLRKDDFNKDRVHRVQLHLSRLNNKIKKLTNEVKNVFQQ